MSSSTIIVIPIFRPKPLKYEVIAIKQAVRIWGKVRPITLIHPTALNVDIYKVYFKGCTELQLISLPDRYFESVRAYNELCFQPWFYELFKSYQYLLIYQTDCFVFKDDISKWENREFDYVGSPFITNKKELWLCGNGGFSFRKIDSIISICKKFKRNPRKTIKSFNELKSLGLVRALLYSFGYCNNVKYSMQKNNYWSEDYFWSIYAKYYKSDYSKPTAKGALEFGFEMQPSTAYKLNHNQLPMGCHAWHNNEFDFWKPIIDSFGYNLDNYRDPIL